MRVAAVQFDIAWEDKPANHAIVEKVLDDAAVQPGTFVLLPELGDTGFSLNVEAIVDERSLTWARDLARRRRIFLQHGFPERGPDGKGRNCAAIIGPDGSLLGRYHKVHPFSFGRESQHYSGGDWLLLRRCGEAIVCPLICYDLRFPELWRHAALAGAEVFSIGASWPAPRQQHWRSLLIARAIENQAYVVAVNRIGNDPHLAYSGGGIILSPKGEVLAEADTAPTVLQADLDLPALRSWRGEFPALSDIHRVLLGAVRIDAEF